MASNLSRFGRWIKGVKQAIWAPPKIEMTVQTEQVLIIRQKQSRRGWCAECGREVEMVGVRDALAIAGGMQPRLGTDSQEWHVCEVGDGARLICLESVLGSG